VDQVAEVWSLVRAAWRREVAAPSGEASNCVVGKTLTSKQPHAEGMPYFFEMAHYATHIGLWVQRAYVSALLYGGSPRLSIYRFILACFVVAT
jgi:hypothetical protein